MIFGGRAPRISTRRFFTRRTGDTAIATANKNSIHGVASGTTNHYAESDPMYWGIRKAFNICPVSRPQTTAGTKVQVPTYFGPTGFAVVSGDCSEGSGTFINVSDEVLDQNGSPLQISGIFPQELVCSSALGCQTSYHTFSTPPSATTAGAFNDTPIGTCFNPPVPNTCVTVTVKYQAYIFGPTNTYVISTASSRTDCVEGEKDQISGNPAAYNQTYKTGTTP